MKTPNNFEKKLKEELGNFYIDLIGGCPEKKDYYFIKKSVKAISTLCEEETSKLEKAYGGCQKCYGKGYATARIGTSRYGNKTSDTIIYCECDRGKALEKQVQEEVKRAKIETLLEARYLLGKNTNGEKYIDKRISELKGKE